MSLKSTVLFSSLCVAVLATPMAPLFAQEQGGIPGIQPAAVETEMSEEELIKQASKILIFKTLEQMQGQLKRDGIELDQEAGLEGARRALAGEPLGMSMQDAQSIMMKLQKFAQAKMKAKVEAMAATNKAEGEAFLAENAKKEGVKTLDGGVQYEVMVAGNGPKPKPNSNVKINYHGMFPDGRVFDSTIEARPGKPAAPVELNSGIFVTGFQTALHAMPVGSKWKIVIPGDQAYGLQGRSPVIGPNQTIVFELELLEIMDSENDASAPATGK